MVVKSLGNVQLPPTLLFITAWQPLSCMRPPVSGWKVGDVSSPFCVSQSSRLGGSGSWRNCPDFHHCGQRMAWLFLSAECYPSSPSQAFPVPLRAGHLSWGLDLGRRAALVRRPFRYVVAKSFSGQCPWNTSGGLGIHTQAVGAAGWQSRNMDVLLDAYPEAANGQPVGCTWPQSVLFGSHHTGPGSISHLKYLITKKGEELHINV